MVLCVVVIPLTYFHGYYSVVQRLCRCTVYMLVLMMSIVGVDGAGVVEEVGPEVTNVVKGDRV